MLNRRKDYFCYICNKYRNGIMEKKFGATDFDELYICDYCGGSFVHEIDPHNDSIPKIEDTTIIEDELLIDEDDEPINKTFRIPMGDPYVKDVLINLFPEPFEHSLLEDIQMLRRLLGDLALLEQAQESINTPVSNEYLNSLKIQTYSDLVKNNDRSNSCSICQEKFEDSSQIISLSCDHIFHDLCISPWLQLNNKCPTCRMSLE